MEINIWTLSGITLITIFILITASRKCNTEKKLVIYILGLSIYVYSGVGIALRQVNDIYILHYTVFLILLFASLRLFSSDRIVFTLGKHNKGASQRSFGERLTNVIENNSRAIRILGIVFLISMFIPIIYPENRIVDMFRVTSFTSIGIHARLQAYQENVIVKICNNIALIGQPFFFVYLYQLIERNKKKTGLVLILLWILFNFGQLNYLSRYELVIYVLFVAMYLVIAKRGRIKIEARWMIAVGIIAVFSLPLLVNFTEIRLGRSGNNLSIIEALRALVESECDYPAYYDRCIANAGAVNPITYLLWLVFLPVPSIIWPGKPAVKISYIFTSLIRGVSSVSSVGYYNILPSILGESFLVFGSWTFWIEAIVLGAIIGIYFKFFLRTEKLSFLTLYMMLMASTIGRGGTQSYLPTIINGSIYFWLWVKICESSQKTNDKNVL